MRLRLFCISFSVVLSAMAGATDLVQAKLFHKISQTMDRTAQKKFVQAASCNPIVLLKEGRTNEARSCAVKLKHVPFIKATKWVYYYNGGKDASFEEIISFINNNPNFPEKNRLMEIAEKKIDSSTNPKILANWCMNNIPTSGNSARYCLGALSKVKTSKENQKVKDCAERCAKIAWMKQQFSVEEEEQFHTQHADFLKEQDHVNRLNYVLSKERKLSPIAFDSLDKEHQDLFKVKLDMMSGRKKKDENFFETASSKVKQDPHLLYLRARWYSANDNHSRLASFLRKYSSVEDTKTDQWFKIRSVLVWDLIDQRAYKLAYSIAADHRYEDPSNYVDGEWLAGKIAYFNLKDPKLALQHFQNILNNSKYSISRAKGAYWSGVATNVLNKGKASNNYFIIASKYIDTFYGQLALMKLNNSGRVRYALPDHPKVTEEDVQWFKSNELLIISHIFACAHKDGPTRKFIRAALEEANTKGKKYLVAKFGKHVEVDLLTTISGKEVARGGDLFIEHSYPILKVSQKQMAIEKALVHSIIRQESEFNPTAKSGAGATGLMQLMHPTAKQIGRKINRPVTADSLKNPDTNVALGSNHLDQLIKQYKGSYVLAIAAYNAGGGNVNKWIKKNGDPRKFKRVDQVVAWIESIPFVETRGYVQYVLSNLQIYRNLLLNDSKSTLKNLHIDLDRDLLL
jgi:soluble lytic murein transglycosylase